MVEPANGESVIEIGGICSDSVTLYAFHDENGNYRLDRRDDGRPAEGAARPRSGGRSSHAAPASNCATTSARNPPLRNPRQMPHQRKQNKNYLCIMEEKRLDAAESLELIGRMIRNTRQRLESHSGRPYLVWGYTTVGISLLNYALNRAGADPLWSLSWFLIPILGYALMRLFPEAAHRPAHGDRPHRQRAVAGLHACADSDFPVLHLPRALLPSEPLRAHHPHDVDRRRWGADRPLEDLHHGRIRGHGALQRSSPSTTTT